MPKIELIDHSELRITPDDRPQMAGLLHTFGNRMGIAKDSDEYLDFIMHPTERSVVSKAAKDDLAANGGWYRADGESEFLAPYWAALEAFTGQKPFAIDLMPALLGSKAWEMGYAVFEKACADESGALRFEGYAQLYKPWSGVIQEPEKAALIRLKRRLSEVLGETVLQPEYIPTGHGDTFRRNPRYATGESEVRPAPANKHVWNAMFSAWLERFAVPEQKAVLARMHVVYPHLDPQIPRPHERVIYLDGCKTNITAEAFRALGDAEFARQMLIKQTKGEA